MSQDTKTIANILTDVFLQGVSDGGTGGSMDSVVSNAVKAIEVIVNHVIGEDEIHSGSYPLNNEIGYAIQYSNARKADQRQRLAERIGSK